MIITKFRIVITIGGGIGGVRGREPQKSTREPLEDIGDVYFTVLCYALEIYFKSLSY